MNNRRTWGKAWAVAVFAFVLAATSAAQQFQIQRADYGYGNLRIDVTQRLRELARSNRTFRARPCWPYLNL